ncbi:cyclin-b2-3-related [Anaeramoeba flamelloides]|uniref:Cyclin-b2-3-related n=1 Tax=Anaeramoeba flamelloides TaxID=1746091 RepID=A0AAV7Z460_9EUKA|nr:cyclin-b2-3-related [Anaeramoeba flamelloides]
MFEYRSNPFRNENENTNLYNPQRQILQGKSQILNTKIGSLKTSQSFNNTTKLFNNKQTMRQRSAFGRINTNLNVNVQNNLNHKNQNKSKVYLKRSVSQNAVSKNSVQQLNQNKVRVRKSFNQGKERLMVKKSRKNVTVKNQKEDKKKLKSRKSKTNKINPLKRVGSQLLNANSSSLLFQNQKRRPIKKKKKIIYNIDKPNLKNPQYVTEFVEDIFSHQKKKEVEQMLPMNFLSVQKKINEKMRGILFDWLCEVHLKFKLKTEVLYLTCKIIDKFLSKIHVPTSKLQLTGITAMLIASKYEEIYPPEVDDFVYISDKSYTREEILKMESIILNVLNFRVTYVSPYFFIQRYVKAAGVGMKTMDYLKLKLLSNYLLELSIPRLNMIKYKPSQLASAAVYLALVSLNTKTLNKSLLWTDTLQYYTKFKLSGIINCARDLRTIAIQVGSADLNDENELLSARKKYKKKRFARISRVPIRMV